MAAGSRCKDHGTDVRIRELQGPRGDSKDQGVTPGSQEFTGAHGRHMRSTEQGNSRSSSGLRGGAAELPCPNPSTPRATGGSPAAAWESGEREQHFHGEKGSKNICCACGQFHPTFGSMRSGQGDPLAAPSLSKAPPPPPAGESLQHSQNSYKVLQNYL